MIPGFADGLNGGVTVPVGTLGALHRRQRDRDARLVKEVINDNGGTAVPADWNLTADPDRTFPRRPAHETTSRR